MFAFESNPFRLLWVIVVVDVVVVVVPGQVRVVVVSYPVCCVHMARRRHRLCASRVRFHT